MPTRLTPNSTAPVPEGVFIIAPKTAYRAELMPRLRQLLAQAEGVCIIGQGSTNFKVKTKPGLVLEQHLSKEVVEHCFIEPARRFALAG